MLEMARCYTDAGYRFARCDDFAKARNYEISKVSYDMILVLDSDEYVTEIDLTELEKQVKLYPHRVGRITLKNYIYFGKEIRSDIEYVNRLFDRRYFRFAGGIHEQLVRIKPPKANRNCTNADAQIRTYQTGIRADHSGYLLNKEEKGERQNAI